MTQAFKDQHYSPRLWFGAASAAFVGVAGSAALWLFFAPPSPAAVRQSAIPAPAFVMLSAIRSR